MTFQMEVVDGTGESLGLPEHFLKIPLTALRCSVRRVIALHLNVPSEIMDEETGYVNDYNGLAEFIGFIYLEIKHFSRQESPTEELLEEWETRDDLQPSIGKLWEGLYFLGRFDVMKDCQLGIVQDVIAFLRNKERQKDIVSQIPDHQIDEGLVLCTGDVEHKEPQFFDAFVSYNCNGDGKDGIFVEQMIKVLENEPNKLKLFIPSRDGLPGAAKYVMDAKLIETRCRRLVIILSDNYLRSDECDFHSKFAQALCPGARSKKIIPVIIEPISAIPEILRYVTLCDFTKVDLQDWFWNRLSEAIKVPLNRDPSGWSQGTPIPSTSGGSFSSIASSPDSAIGQSLSLSPDSKKEIPSESESDWVDLSSEFSSESEMSLSMSPPAITSSSKSNSLTAFTGKVMNLNIKRLLPRIGK